MVRPKGPAASQRLRVLALVPAALDTTPGQRFRVEQWHEHLRASGIEISYSSFLGREEGRQMAQRGPAVWKAALLLSALRKRIRTVNRETACDLVYIFRESALVGPALVERLLARRRIPFVFDFDDAVWVRYLSPTNSFFSYLRFPGKTGTSCRLASHVLAGNAFLRDYALGYNTQCTVIPTTIDTAKYRPRPPSPCSVPVVGWTGSPSTERYMLRLRAVLERLARRREFRVVVVGGGTFAARGVAVEHRPWCSATETGDLSDIDVGVMPLDDTDWERGKCGLKALQYMALGIAPIVSPVGCNTDIVTDGVNGLIANSEAEWETALEGLIRDAELRRRLGGAARETVERRYSTDVHAPRVAAALRAAMSGFRPAQQANSTARAAEG